MSGGKKNLPASVAARLLNRAKQAGDEYQTLLTSFCIERFLYRLGTSEVRDRFVLKGAMLLRAWSDRPYRATRDLDLLRRGDSSFEAIRSDIRTICTTPVEPDAVTFDAHASRTHAIRADDERAGTRTILPARSGTARLNLQIDIGLGDSVWPEPQPCTYPPLLEFPAPNVLAYPPFALTPAYWENPSRPAQVRAFARRAGLAVPADPDAEFVGLLGGFLLPILGDARAATPCAGKWPPGGPWGAAA